VNKHISEAAAALAAEAVTDMTVGEIYHVLAPHFCNSTAEMHDALAEIIAAPRREHLCVQFPELAEKIEKAAKVLERNAF